MSKDETQGKVYCQRRTIKGGHGVDDASGVREWACDREPGHDGPCNYERLLGAVGMSQ